MSYTTFMKALNEAKPLHEVDFVGFGEPLMHPRFLDMIEEVHKRRLFWNFATNGTLLTKEIANRLSEMGDGKISISFDGATKATYESIRINSSYEKVLENIKYLAEVCKKNNSKIQLRLDFVAMKSNIQELPQVVQLAHDVGFYAVNILNIQPLSKELEAEHLLNLPPTIIEEHFAKAKELAKKLGIYLTLRPSGPELLLQPCINPWRDCFVGVDGKVNACCLTGAPKEKVTEYLLGTEVELDPKALEFGDINEKHFNIIYFSKKFMAFREELKKVMAEDAKTEWTIEKYLELRRKNKCPKNYCKICAARWRCVC
jgi:MoaA/NifB/PqqE/SkfB family radical SAM enzyme